MESGSRKPSPTCKVRLQKHLAACGLGSRRACEALISDGRVKVNGRLVSLQGLCIDPEADAIEVDGRSVRVERKFYLLLNKPCGVLCTCQDTHQRRTFMDLLPGVRERVFPVGRLDLNSEGLLIVTNDGALALALTHPRHEVAKTYLVQLNGPLSFDDLRRMQAGLMSEGQRLRAAEAAAVGAGGKTYRIVLREGRKRQIRRMVELLGRKVLRLQRVAIGPVQLGGLRSGASRPLTAQELDALWAAAGDRGGAVQTVVFDDRADLDAGGE